MANETYTNLVKRNSGYIDLATQERIKNTRLLIAGCGIGSSVAVLAVRMGFTHFTVIDADTVDVSNLNRQFYAVSDVGKNKAQSLKSQILAINPQAQVEVVEDFLTPSNAEQYVKTCDIIIDTIDFLDLSAILALHKAASVHQVPIITALSAGFGALVWAFKKGEAYTLLHALAPVLEKLGPGASYAQVFAEFMKRIMIHLDVEVVKNIQEVLVNMAEQKPCPASQLAIGSFSVAALAGSMLHDLLHTGDVLSGKDMVVVSFKSHQVKKIHLIG